MLPLLVAACLWNFGLLALVCLKSSPSLVIWALCGGIRVCVNERYVKRDKKGETMK